MITFFRATLPRARVCASRGLFCVTFGEQCGSLSARATLAWPRIFVWPNIERRCRDVSAQLDEAIAQRLSSARTRRSLSQPPLMLIRHTTATLSTSKYFDSYLASAIYPFFRISFVARFWSGLRVPGRRSRMDVRTAEPRSSFFATVSALTRFLSLICRFPRYVCRHVSVRVPLALKKE